MTRLTSFLPLLPLSFVALALAPIPTLRGGEGERLSVLFLGDEGHHRPAARAKQLIPVLSARGIDVTYTDYLGDLDPEVLARHDCLVVYANAERIEPGEERALLDYVAAGGGFVALHCASYCFHNSPRYIELVGAQFKSHGTGVFRTRITASEHPVMRDFPEFETWDETYVHAHHNEDRTVLQTRREGDRDEPWTWVRAHGKGRVFYTAYGHDERTWSSPGFQLLVERGIRWAAGDDQPFATSGRERTGLKPFEYTKAVLPNYLPGRAWGTQGDPIDRMQLPLSPEESMRHMVVPRGFAVELFAAEPEIQKPVCMAWDERGRLWIAETVDYPNDIQRAGSGNDRLKIVEDTNGDGRADRFTVFAEKLSIPTSLAFARGGVIVHQAPDTLFLKDTDGDDRADERRVLLSGWSTTDTHAGPSNMRWGFDNWIWGIVGYSGFNGEVGGERHRFATGFYRFRPDGSAIEFIRNTNNNSWGIGLSEEGIVFGSTANGNPSVYMPIPNRYYDRVRGWSSSRLEQTAVNARFYPITDGVRQVDHHGNFTSGAGHALYTARSFPREYWNRTAFVNEPTGHLSATFRIAARGSDFVSRNSWNLLASDDEWTAPIAAEVGPDGAVWVLDWYNYIVQHNPTPHGFRTGKGAAYETDLRDKTHGRIYRIRHREAKPSAPPSLWKAEPAALLAALGHENLLWRLHAQRLLVERGERDVVPQLIALTREAPLDAIGLAPAAIHALWTLDGLGAVAANSEAAAAAAAALRHPSAGVRRSAVLVLPRAEEGAAALITADSLRDADAQVRLAAFLTLSEMPPSGTAGTAGAAVLAALCEPRNAEDRWIPDAAASAGAAHDGEFLAAVALHRGPAPGKVVEVVARVAEHHARGGPAETAGALLARLDGAPPALAEAVVTGLVKGWPRGLAAKLDGDAERALGALLESLSPAGKGQLLQLAARWGSKALDRYSAEVAASYLAVAEDAQREDAERVEAAKRLVEFRAEDGETVDRILALITARASPDLSEGLLDAAGSSRSTRAPAALLEALPGLTPSLRRHALGILLSRSEWTKAFLAAAEEGAADLTLLALDQKQALARHPDAEVARRARELLEKKGELPNPDREKVIAELLHVTGETGDAARGKEVFKEQCSKCHVHGSEGARVGPDLTGMAVHPKSELLVQILDPSRSVEGNFLQYAFVTDTGDVLNGMLASESRNAVEVYDAEGKKHVLLRENIVEMAASRLSMMPEGFEKQLQESGLRDLLEFLTARGKYLPLPLDKAATAVSTRGMFNDERSDVERLIFADWTPKTFDGIPFQLVDPRGDRTPNVILLHGPQGRFPPTMPPSVTVPCNAAARAIHLLSGVSGWGAQGGGGGRRTVSMIVRLHYAGGETEEHPLENGVHFADYIGHFDVPGSKLAFKLRGQQIRYLAIAPQRSAVIERIEFVKGPDRTAPIVMAVTVEAPESL
jgi:hypothetical protein